MIRNGWRLGRHLMVDSESGLVHYDDEMVKIWNGTYRHWTNTETRHPQEFIRARKDPKPLRNVFPDVLVDEPDLVQPVFVGNTTIRTGTGPATHLFDPGIGDMEIENSFIVR